MARYKWIITEDHVKEAGAPTGTNLNAIGLQGPRGCDARTAAELPDKFRMYDDDDELYYEGVSDCLTNPEAPEGGFEPLDDFGRPNAGCTRIDYYNHLTDSWDTL